MNGTFRTCPTTGLRVHAQADGLIKANAVVATVALLIGGITAVLVMLTRWQVVHLLSAEWFYRLLTVHGMNMLIFFILFFEMAVLYFASAVLLNSRVATPKLAWASGPCLPGRPTCCSRRTCRSRRVRGTTWASSSLRWVPSS
jgi:cytochrome c oxidase subunit 1